MIPRMENSKSKSASLLDLLDELIDLPHEERELRIAQAQPSEADRSKLDSWLRLHDSSGQFLEKPPRLVLDSMRLLRNSGERSSSFNTGQAGASDSSTAKGDALGTATPPQVPGYEIIELLGQGGMGTVWRAVQMGTGREVALKVMEPLLLASPRARSRFERELRLTARLRHPHITRVYDGGSTGSVCYNAMELIHGLPLDHYIQSQKFSGPRERQTQVLQLMIKVCQAVAHAHQNAIIHRDLKPSNILIDQDGQPHLVDFGLAKALEEAGAELTITFDGDLAGTPAYMSPEQAGGSASLDTRTDVYSLGVILYRLLTDRFPHDLTGSRMQVLQRIAGADPAPPRAVSSKVDRTLEAVLLRSLAPRPDNRYPSVADLAKDLEAYLSGDPTTACPMTQAERFRGFVRRNRVGLSIASAFAIILVAGTVVSSWQAVRATRFADKAGIERNNALHAQAAEAAQRLAAERARAETERINRFLSGMTASVDLRDTLNWIREKHRPDDQPPGSADVLSELADHMRSRGRIVEAEALSREALRQDQQAGNSRGITAMYHWVCHSQILNDKGDRDGAEEFAIKTLNEARREFPQPNRLLGYAIFYAASVLEEHGKYAQAQPLAEEARRLRDQHPEIDAAGGGDDATALCLTHIYWGLKMPDEARLWHGRLRVLCEARLPELTASVNGEPYDAGKHGKRGVVYGRIGRFREAAEDFASAVRLHTEEPYAWEQLMAALLGAGEDVEYQRVRSEALGISVHNSDPEQCAGIARAALIESSIGGGDLNAAAELAGRVSAQAPDSSWACFTQGLSQYRSGKYSSAIIWLARDRRENAREERREAMTELLTAMAFSHLGRRPAADSALRHGLQIMQTSLQPAENGDLAFDGTGCGDNFQDMVFARRVSQEAMAAFKLDRNAATQHGAQDPRLIWRAPQPNFWNAGQRRKLEVLSECLSIEPDDAAGRGARGETYAALGDFREAAIDFGRALNAHPPDPRALRFGLPVFLIRGDSSFYSHARSQAVGNLDGRAGGALLAVCSLLGQDSSPQVIAAASYADQLVAADGINPWNCLAKGIAEYRRGHDAAAVRWLTAADADESVRDDRRLASSRFFLAMAQSRRGNREDAQSDLDIAQALLQRKQVKPEDRDLSDSTLLDWLVCQCASREARAVMSPR
jgi:serine/threonine protein kinase/tetratricopeptide (TPR) repeat protein